MEKRTKVTALVPAYQSAGFIQETLDSLSAQTHENFAVIISVDLCDDDTYALCQRHCNLDSRFSVLKQNKRLGYVGNCNFLLGQVDSEYVLFAFHDDLLAPEYLKKLCNVLDSRSEVIMAYSDVLLTEVNKETKQWVYTEIEGVHDRVERGLKMMWRMGLWWVPNRGVFRLQEARRINGLKSHAAGEFCTDLPWLFHMSLLGEFARIPETLCFKFYKPESLSQKWEHSAAQSYALYVACMFELWSSDLSFREKVRMTLPFFPRMINLRMKTLVATVRG